ncbi:MAG: sigma-70 domain-containing protein [Nitrososphaerota archaeon]
MKELYENWRKNPTKENMNKILEAARPLIISEAIKWSKGLSPELILPKAEALTINAIKTYNPRSGTALSTHIVNNLQPLSRMAYKYQAAVRLPEYKLFKKFEFDRARKELFMELSREPTVDELAERLKWSKSAVAKMLASTMKGEGIESIELPMFQASSNIDLDYIYHSLNPIQQQVFKYSTGYMGVPIKSTRELARMLKMSEPQIYRIKTTIAKIIKEYKKES